MIKLFRWLLGYVEFCFSGGFIEGFINDCYYNKINIYRLDKIDNVLVGRVNVNRYKMLHRIALKHGGTIKIIKKRGPVFALLKIKNRYGLFAGCIVFLFIINFLSGFVWDIQITGNSKLANAQIENILNENGLKIGKHWSKVNTDNIENYIMASLDDCAWTHINRKGTTAVVEIDEATPKPPIDPKITPTNLKASKDGIIVKAYIHGGWKVADVGDNVKKGDLLVSGVSESEHNKTNVYANGSGEYIAKVKEEFKLVVNRKQSLKNYGKTKNYKKLVFYNLRLPLYIGKIKYNSSDYSTSERYLHFNGKKLPIGIINVAVTPYNMYDEMLDDKALTNLLNTEIEKKIQAELGRYEIISRNLEIELNPNDAVVSGYIDCLENIGQTFKITKDDEILCLSKQDNIKKNS